VRFELWQTETLEIEDVRFELWQTETLEIEDVRFELWQTETLEIEDVRFELWQTETLEVEDVRFELWQTETLEIEDVRLELWQTETLEIEEVRFELWQTETLEIEDVRFELWQTETLEIEDVRFELWQTEKLNKLGYLVVRNVSGPKLGDVHKRNSSVPFSSFHFNTSNIPRISKLIYTVSHAVFIANIVFSLTYSRNYTRVDFPHYFTTSKLQGLKPIFYLNSALPSARNSRTAVIKLPHACWRNFRRSLRKGAVSGVLYKINKNPFMGILSLCHSVTNYERRAVCQDSMLFAKIVSETLVFYWGS
jgi:hypothetical protein